MDVLSFASASGSCCIRHIGGSGGGGGGAGAESKIAFELLIEFVSSLER